MQRLFLLVEFFLVSACLSIAQGTGANNSQPVPMAPIAQWPPATPTAPAHSTHPEAVPAAMTPMIEWPATTPTAPNAVQTPQKLQISERELRMEGFNELNPGQNLVEAAREARARAAKSQSHIYTDDDIARLHVVFTEPTPKVQPDATTPKSKSDPFKPDL
jgi:hypothetical protein